MSENNNGFKKMVYPEPAKGSYIGAIERLFVGQTKTGKMALKICVRLFDGCDEAGRGFVESWPGKNPPLLWVTQLLSGTKNDQALIEEAIKFLTDLYSPYTVEFYDDYDSFGVLVDNIFKYINGVFVYQVNYEPEKFTKLKVCEVYPVERGE